MSIIGLKTACERFPDHWEVVDTKGQPLAAVISTTGDRPWRVTLHFAPANPSAVITTDTCAPDSIPSHEH